MTATPTAGLGSVRDGAFTCQVWALRLVMGGAFLAVWGWAHVFGLPRDAFSTPGNVGAWLRDWVATGDIWPELQATLSAAALGYVVGMVTATAVAALFAFTPGVAPVLEPYMSVLNSIPVVVLAPLSVLIFGTGVASKAAVAGLMVFFVAFFQLYGGFRSVDSSLVNNAKVLGASRFRLATSVYLPAAFSWIISTMRTGVGLAVVGVVVAEIVGGNAGVGYVINLGQQLGQPELTVGGIVVLAVVAVIVDLALVRIERRVSMWRVF